MPVIGRKFKFFGAFKKKSAAKKKERSKECKKKCFIVPRKIRGGKRFVVLARK
jgi:hypothetical protein